MMQMGSQVAAAFFLGRIQSSLLLGEGNEDLADHILLLTLLLIH